jgi:hypothetical protein
MKSYITDWESIEVRPQTGTAVKSYTTNWESTEESRHKFAQQ